MDVSNIQEKLAEGDFEAGEWKELGTNLGIKPGGLKTLAATYEGNIAHGHGLALVDVLDKWMRSDREASWNKLADAMDRIKFPKVARELRSQVPK